MNYTTHCLHRSYRISDGIAELFAKLSDVSRIMNDSESKIIRNTEEQMAEYSERIKNLSDYVHFMTANHSVDLMELRTGLLDHQGIRIQF